MHPSKTAKQVCAFLGLAGYYRKFIKDFTKMAKLLTILTHHKAKFEWTPAHHTAFMTLKDAIIQAPILPYPDPAGRYIVYTDALDNACGAQLSQEHNGAKFAIAFLSHTFTETQRKWSTSEQEAYGVYYAITKWKYYLQGADIIVHNDHKPLAKFLNGKNANNKVNRWGLELATFNITFEWISGAWNKAADCLSRLVKLPNNSKAIVKMLLATNLDGPFNTRSKTSHHHQTTTDTEPSNTQPIKETVTRDLTTVETTQDIMPKPLIANKDETLLQMQKMDPFSKHISKHLLNGKAPKHEADLFTHVKGLLYRHVMDANQKFMALIITKAWKYIVLVEAHDKLGHQGVTCMYCLIKWQCSWKGMNKDIQKYIANCTLCHREKAKVQSYPLQVTEIPGRPFNKVTIDLVTECETSTSGNRHILTIIDHLTGWLEGFPIPDKSTYTIVLTFINHYLPVHMCPWYILLDNGTEF